jgi:hypothetical protein
MAWCFSPVLFYVHFERKIFDTLANFPISDYFCVNIVTVETSFRNLFKAPLGFLSTETERGCRVEKLTDCIKSPLSSSGQSFVCILKIHTILEDFLRVEAERDSGARQRSETAERGRGAKRWSIIF